MTAINRNDFSVAPKKIFTPNTKSRATTLNLTDWLILSFINGVGPARLDRLKRYVDTINQTNETYLIYPNSIESNEKEPLLELDEDLLLKLKWPKQAAKDAATYLIKGVMGDDVCRKFDETLLWLQEQDHYLISKDDSAYPESLRQIPVAPMLLYIKGNTDVLSQPKIGMVGARKCTAHGRDSAFYFARELSSLGFIIVSGGALGIDSSSHMGALSVNAPTIAVMGAGLNNLYPKINLRLYDDLLEKRGAIISEYPINTSVKAHLFPPRNRIISGLSLGVFVVEATIKSGSLISAHYAIQHNREVFALPSRITDSQSSGNLMLIQQGAKLVTSVQDIIMELPLNEDSSDSRSGGDFEDSFSGARGIGNDQKNNVSREIRLKERVKVLIPWAEISLIASSKCVIEYIDAKIKDEDTKGHFEFDELINAINVSTSELSQALIELELLGIIEPFGNGYMRCYEN